MSSGILDSQDLAMDSLVEGRFRIEGVLGRGGFATVYRAHQLSVDRPVAIKVLDPINRGGNLADLRERFVQEAKIAAKLEHPNIVNIIDYGIIDSAGQPYIVMALLRGRDLGQELKRVGPLKPSRALPLFVDVLNALGTGHQMGVIHKDLKPSNLFLVNAGQAEERLCVLDFGVARMSLDDGNAQKITQTGHFLGTPQYLTPEYINEQSVSPALDVYQMGLILVEAMTGRPLIDAPNPAKCVVKSSVAEFTIPEALLTSELGPILQKALAYKQTDRFPDATAFGTALRDVDPVPLDGLKLEQQRTNQPHDSPPYASPSILNTPTRNSVDGIGYAHTETTESLPPSVFPEGRLSSPKGIEATANDGLSSHDQPKPVGIAQESDGRHFTVERSDLAWVAQQKRSPLLWVLMIVALVILVLVALPSDKSRNEPDTTGKNDARRVGKDNSKSVPMTTGHNLRSSNSRSAKTSDHTEGIMAQERLPSVRKAQKIKAKRTDSVVQKRPVNKREPKLGAEPAAQPKSPTLTKRPPSQEPHSKTANSPSSGRSAPVLKPPKSRPSKKPRAAQQTPKPKPKVFRSRTKPTRSAPAPQPSPPIIKPKKKSPTQTSIPDEIILK